LILLSFKTFKTFNRYAPFKPSPFFEAATIGFLPRDAGEDEGGGLNVLNGLNDLNRCCSAAA
jgi:hypothetical protein